MQNEPMKKSVNAPLYDSTLTVLCDQWLKKRSDYLKPSTIIKYRNTIEKYIKPRLGALYIEELQTERIHQFSNQLLHQNGLSAKTVRDILILLHAILENTCQQTFIQFSMPDIVYPKSAPTELRVLTNTEQQQLVHYLNLDMDIYKFSVLLALATGLRIGEICALRWKNISTTSSLLQVRYTVQRIQNLSLSSSKKTSVQLGTPKTYSSIRTIPLTESIRKLCLRFDNGLPETFVLTGTEHFAEPRVLQRKLKLYTDACHLENVHFHTLRHTFATRCVEVGCDVKTLSEILGHSNIAMTMNRYVHPSLELKRQNLQKLDQAGFGAVPKR